MPRISSAPDGGEPSQKGAVPRRIGRTKGGLNSKLHAVTDQDGKPLILLLSEGQMSDHKGARLMLDALPDAESLTGDRGYDSDWFRNALTAKGITPCIPPKKNRKVQHGYDRALYKKRHKIECSFGKIKDWRRIAMRYDRCAHTFFSAICIAATVIFYL
jgi:transposase